MSPCARPFLWLVVGTLLATHAVGQRTRPDSVSIPEARPIARFRAQPLVGVVPLTVEFQDLSIADATSWSWYFGDGATSNQRSPFHIYESPGTYTVTLVITARTGTGTQSRTGYVTVLEPPLRADFTATPTAGVPPLEVRFTDQSIGIVTQRLWQFGDGQSSTQRDPVHTYAARGEYPVSLSVSGPEGEDTLVQEGLISVDRLLPGFVDEVVFDAPYQATGFLVLDENDVIVWTKAGQVWRWRDGAFASAPLADISAEVANWNDHGLHGFALDPDYASNGYVYLYYAVDRHHLDHHGTPTYDPQADEFDVETIGRLTRYAVYDAADPATTIDPSTRSVLVGEDALSGIPLCATSHGLGRLLFGEDGSLLFSSGDSSNGPTFQAECAALGLFRPKDDVEGLRAQLVDGPNGKLHRIDPLNGNGWPNNPFFDASNPRSWASRVWALGLRNPYRVALRPHTGRGQPGQEHPGTIYVGDVGELSWEEISVVKSGGQNLGWPFYEAFAAHEFLYDWMVNLDAPNPLFGSGGCMQAYFRFSDLLLEDSLNAPFWPNPCDPSQTIPASLPRFVHRRPAVAWGHGESSPFTFVKDYDAAGAAIAVPIDSGASPVAGAPFIGNASIGGTWYTGGTFPQPFQDVYFHVDFGERWVKAFAFDEQDDLLAIHDFAAALGNIVQLGTDPAATALYYLTYEDSPALKRILYGANAAPIAVAQASASYGPAPLSVALSGAASVDPEGAPLEFEWDFGTGGLWSPLNTWEETGHVFGSEDITHLAQPLDSGSSTSGSHVQHAQRLQAPPRAGAPLPNMRDGGYAVEGSEDAGLQELVDERVPLIGYLLPQPRVLVSLIFQEGRNRGSDGGWLAAPRVEWWNDGAQRWEAVSNLHFHPEYPADLELAFETFHVSFEPVETIAIRLREGSPALGPRQLTVGELRLIARADPLPTAPLTQTATLTVTDPFGEQDTTQTSISLNNTPPTVEILAPLDGQSYPVNEPTTVPLFAEISDAEHATGSLACEWRVELVHDNHVHPEPIDVSCTSHFMILPHGELQGDIVYWTVELRVTDPHGLSTSVLHTLVPEGDCNLNGIDDALDILLGSSLDSNANGLPDECE